MNIFRHLTIKPKTTHRPELALDMARLSRMAYYTPEYVENMWQIAQQKKQIGVLEPDFQTVQVLKQVPLKPIFCNSPIGDSQSYAIYYNQPRQSPKLVLAARGTSSWKDALCDANIRLIHCNDFGMVPTPHLRGSSEAKIEYPIKIHSGFYQQFRALQESFDSIVDPYMSKTDNCLICTGHSLGGAVATISALVYAIKYPQRISYYGFGSPRVGNTPFAELFDQHIREAHRYKRKSDPVAKIPLAFIYQHVGKEHHFGQRDNHPNIPLLSNVSDHDIDGYVTDLHRNVLQNTKTNLVKHLNFIRQ